MTAAVSKPSDSNEASPTDAPSQKPVVVRQRKATRERRRASNLAPEAKAVWVTARVAASILAVTTHYLAQMKRLGKFTKTNTRDEYNLAEVLEQYRILLNKNGQLVQDVESVCLREFKDGKLPDEVIIEHNYAYDIVKRAWDHHIELRRDPEIARIEAERQASTKKQEVVRCRECLRSSIVALEDTHRIVRETTGEPERTAFNLNEERALVGVDIRCSACRMLKATAPLDAIRARLRVLAIQGPPKPIDVNREMPLPPTTNGAPTNK